MLRELYSSTNIEPLLVAPGGFFDDPQWYAQLLEVSGPDVLDALSHHVYNLGGGDDPCIARKITSPTYLGGFADTFRNVQLTIERHGPWSSAWVGEAGGVYNSGSPLVSNTFLNSIWYLDQLGMASRYNTKVYCRQTLIGGNYGLLDTHSFIPNPDYYSALLWHQLMGKGVLSVNISETTYLRGYAHCSKAKSGITLLLINLCKSATMSVKLRNDPNVDQPRDILKSSFFSNGRKRAFSWFVRKASGGSQEREEYHLTAKDGRHLSRTMLLNGNPLQLTSAGDIPDLRPMLVAANDPISITPLSIAFARSAKSKARNPKAWVKEVSCIKPQLPRETLELAIQGKLNHLHDKCKDVCLGSTTEVLKLHHRLKITGKMSYTDIFGDGEYETAVAASAYVITTLQEEEDMTKQKKTAAIVENTVARTKSKPEANRSSPSFNWKWLGGKEASEDQKQTGPGDTIWREPVEVERAATKNYDTRQANLGKEMDVLPTLNKMPTLKKEAPSEKGSERTQSIKGTLFGSNSPTNAKFSTGYKHGHQYSNEHDEIERVADSWEKAELIKAKNRYEKMMSVISEWQTEKKTKAKRQMERKQGGPSHKRSKALQHYHNEISRIDQIAGEARALAKERKQNNEAKIREKAAKIRSAGKMPSACCSFF
ncbi:hypothetical protein HPP92_016942 [Vanilla planifolia]|uniref:Remorin C-terminal domain-containing protein n=1 Tax=Vanilla planifolia TaxID=51239 RepID=A0A835QK58_VANPL|nr:hypothetical protein HPP92_016942 [Vanilla planifolia]